MSDLRIDFDPPQDGWMEVRLRDGAATWSVVASCVFDFVTELAGAALELAEERPVREVIFFEEPAANVLTFAVAADQIELTVTWYVEESRRAGAKRCFQTRAPREAIVRAIWSGLRRLDGALGRDAVEAGWHRAFPIREVEQVGHRLRAPAAERS